MITPPQAAALRAMALSERGALHRWHGGYWCAEAQRAGVAIPRDYVATGTVNALVARRWAAAMAWRHGGGYLAVEITQEGRTLAATLNPAQVSKDEVLTITDSSSAYGGATKTAWSWDFSAVTGYTLVGPTDQPSVQVKFSTTGAKNIQLQVTDSDGLSCKKGFNDLPSDSLPNVTVGRSVPTNFQEITP